MTHMPKPDAMTMSDGPLPTLTIRSGRIAAANAAACRLFERSEEDAASRLVGRSLSDLVTAVRDQPFGFPEDVADADAAEARWTVAEWRGADGTPRRAALCIHEPNGAHDDAPRRDWPESFTAILTPLPQPTVSQGSTPGHSLAEAADAHHQLVRLFANLAHEMRTPLNAIIGFGEILENQHFGPLSDRYVDYSHDITAAGRYLLAIVNGALEIGSVSGGHRLQESTVELAPLIKSAINILSARADDKGIEITFDRQEAGVLVIADETKITQVLANVLSNAIKYSRRVSRVRVTSGFRDDRSFAIRIADEGVGMSAADIETALLPFGRADYATGQAEPGMGLGLPISKAILEAHGGSLEIESKPAAGTVVSIVLPADRIIRPEENFLSSLVG